MSASPAGVFNIAESTDLGLSLVGGRLYSYVYGTTTNKLIYSDPAGSIPFAQTSDGAGGFFVALNARGELDGTPYFLPGPYTVTLKRADGSTVWTRRADPIGDAGAATLTSLAASGGSALVGFLQAGVGAVARTASDKFRDEVSAFDFMTPAQVADVKARTFTQDVTSAINAALASGAGRVRLPRGGYLVSSQLTVPASTSLQGDGKTSTELRVIGSGYDAVSLVGNYSSLRDVSFSSATQRTSGKAVSIPNATRGNSVSDIRFQNQFTSIGIGGEAVISWISDCEILDTTAATGVSIDIAGGNDTFLNRVVADANVASQPLCGLRITQSQAVWVTDCDWIHHGTGLHICPNTGQVITWLFFNGSAFDSGAGDGIRISPTGTGSIRGLFFNGCWSATNAGRGVLIEKAAGATVDGVFLDQFKSLNNGQHGVLTLAGCNNVRISDPVISGNSQSSVGVYAGVDFQPGVSNWSVSGGQIGAALAFTVTQSYGILVNAGASNTYSITGVDVQGNTSGGIFDGGTGGSKHIANNLGYATQSKGVADVPIGASSVLVTHGLAAAPTLGSISIVPTQRLGASGILSWWLTSIGPTTFTVMTDGVVSTAAFTFEWRANLYA